MNASWIEAGDICVNNRTDRWAVLKGTTDQMDDGPLMDTSQVEVGYWFGLLPLSMRLLNAMTHGTHFLPSLQRLNRIIKICVTAISVKPREERVRLEKRLTRVFQFAGEEKKHYFVVKFSN